MESHSFLFNKDLQNQYDDEFINFIENHIASEVSASEIKDQLTTYFDENGWIQKFKYSADVANTISAVRAEVGICTQFGNVARLFYDVLKLEHCYDAGIISSSIIICPLSPSGNRGYLDRLYRELQVYQNVINVPICAIGVKIKE
jgi:hypothetical protein